MKQNFMLVKNLDFNCTIEGIATRKKHFTLYIETGAKVTIKDCSVRIKYIKPGSMDYILRDTGSAVSLVSLDKGFPVRINSFNIDTYTEEDYSVSIVPLTIGGSNVKATFGNINITHPWERKKEKLC